VDLVTAELKLKLMVMKKSVETGNGKVMLLTATSLERPNLLLFEIQLERRIFLQMEPMKVIETLPP